MGPFPKGLECRLIRPNPNGGNYEAVIRTVSRKREIIVVRAICDNARGGRIPMNGDGTRWLLLEIEAQGRLSPLQLQLTPNSRSSRAGASPSLA